MSSAIPINDKIGFGTMSLSWIPNPKPIKESAATIEYVTSKYGVKYLNAGEFYGADDINLKIIKEFLDTTSQPTNEFIISIKGGLDLATFKILGTKESISKSIENCASYFAPIGDSKRPKILYEIARVDPNVPYADTISYIHDYVKLGHIDGISLSEVSAKSIATAAEIAPISCVEVEFSFITQDIVTNGVLKECSSRDIAIVAYSPLGRGLLTNYAVENSDTFLKKIPEGDMRLHFDRFAPENFDSNLKYMKKLYEFAQKKNTSLESLSLSWFAAVSQSSTIEGLGKLPKIVPIPSGSTPQRIDSNFGHLIELSPLDLQEIQEIISSYTVQGYRYNEHAEGTLFQ